MHPTEKLTLRGDHITLDALMKACGAVSSGGEAKQLIASGAVQVNGSTEQRRGRKLRIGDQVTVKDKQVAVVAAAAPPADSSAQA